MFNTEIEKESKVKSVSLHKIEHFEDIIERCGSTGRRNKLIFICTSLGSLIHPLLVFTYHFLGVTPDHWCQVSELWNTSWTPIQIRNLSIPFSTRDSEMLYDSCQMYDLNYTALNDISYEEALIVVDSIRNKAIMTCNNRYFDSGFESIVTKWDLVCDRRVIYSTIQGAIHAGELTGSFLSGFLMDRVGRVTVYRTSVIGAIIFGYLVALSPTVEVFIILKFTSAVMVMGYYMSAFVIGMEIATMKQRSLVGSYYVIPWPFGMMMAAGIAYLVRPWNYLQIALTTPTLILLYSCWILQESPRWLIIKGKHKEAFGILQSIAKSNGNSLKYDSELQIAMKTLQAKDQTTTLTEKKSFWQNILGVFKNLASLLVIKELRFRTLVTYFCWWTAALVYYSVSLGSSALSTSDYLFIFLGGLLELPSYLLLWPAAALLGRKKTAIMNFIVCVITLLAVMILIIVFDKNEYETVKLVLFLIGKVAITQCFHLLWVYTAELYPTAYRSLAIGQSSTIARAGGICSSYINDLLGEAAAWAPTALFVLFSATTALVATTLPETANCHLSDGITKKNNNMADSEENKGK